MVEKKVAMRDRQNFNSQELPFHTRRVFGGAQLSQSERVGSMNQHLLLVMFNLCSLNLKNVNDVLDMVNGMPHTSTSEPCLWLILESNCIKLHVVFEIMLAITFRLCSRCNHVIMHQLARLVIYCTHIERNSIENRLLTELFN